jgi:uncharacterized protein (TIGR04141 family)
MPSRFAVNRSVMAAGIVRPLPTVAATAVLPTTAASCAAHLPRSDLMRRTSSRPPTRLVTLYRLTGVRPDIEGMVDALDTETVARSGLDLHFPSALAVPSVAVVGRFERAAPEWRRHFAITTGLDVAEPESHGACLLLLAVDEHVYAIGYGAGFRLVPESKKDPRFGLRVAIRVLDPAQVRDLVRRSPALYGRTDATIVPGGMPIWAFGVEEHTDVVGRAGGATRRLGLTCAHGEDDSIAIEGASGLRVRLGVRPADLVADLREIARALDADARPGLEFIDAFQPVGDELTTLLLDDELDRLLSGGEDAGLGRVHPVVPIAKLRDFEAARGFIIRFAGMAWRTAGPDLPYLLRRSRSQRDGRRIERLRAGRIELYTDPGCTELISGSSTLKWLEVSVSLGERSFFLMEGRWYEIGTGYLAARRRETEDLITADPGFQLPPWEAGWDEKRYNLHVSDVLPGAVCLDRQGVRTRLHPGNGVEACDVLTRDDVLVHVKRADASAPLSHLFAQGLVSMETLRTPEGASRFAEVVASASGGRRRIALPFTPRKIVFAILLKAGEQLAVDTLFPFSQVTLANVARTIQSRYGVRVEVVGINAAE